MEDIKIGKHKVKIYSGVDDMPISRYNKFNMFLLRDSGVGSTFKDIMTRLAHLDGWLAKENIENAMVERKNLQLTFFTALNEINFQQMAFACLIVSIDNADCNDLSDQGIMETLKKLEDTGITQKELLQINQKKKTIVS